jgi:hypothetical protein
MTGGSAAHSMHRQQDVAFSAKIGSETAQKSGVKQRKNRE